MHNIWRVTSHFIWNEFLVINLTACEGCERRRQAMNAWLKKLTMKGMNIMATANKREKAALAALAKESGVSENTVARVIDAMQRVDAVGLTLLLKIGKNAETEPVADASIEDAAPSAGKKGSKE